MIETMNNTTPLPKTKDRIRYSYHRAILGRRFVSPHVLSIARRHEGKTISFGWSLCIPSRWETKEGDRVTEAFYDTKEKTFVSREFYEDLVNRAGAIPTYELLELDKIETDGALLVVDEKEEKLIQSLQDKLEDIEYHRSVKRVATSTLVKGDQFERAVGRRNAVKRLMESPTTIQLAPFEFATEAIMNYLRNSADVPRQASDIAEIEYQKLMIQAAMRNATKDFESAESDFAPQTFSERFDEVWNSDIGRTTLILGGVCLSWIAGLVLCSVFR